ncbi:MAG: MFS family permease [Flavobacteriales bacterium]
MQKTLISLFPLFISCFILFLGNGLINVLLPVRMGLDGVDINTIGTVLSLYFVGMLVGAIYAKELIKRAGHIRMFSSCVALAAISTLLCSLYSDPILWGVMRVVIGFCNACALTAMESWLSHSSDKNNRGKVLATYNAVVLGGLFGGQFLMNIANPIDTSLFVVAGILLCAASIPIGLSAKKGPTIELVEPMPLLKLYKTSPLGVVSCLISGVVYSALFNLLPVFANEFKIVEFQLSLYMGAGIFGALVLQFPVGYLSDRFDRRKILLVLLVISAAAGLINIVFAQQGYFLAMFVVTGITCGIISCIYPLSIAEAFDRLRQSEMVAAMGSMILAFSVGGILGPFLASLSMNYFGATALFYFLGVVQCLLASFVIYRMMARQALPVEQQESFVMQNSAVLPLIELDPRSEYLEQLKVLSVEGETAVAIAKVNPATAVKMAQAISIVNPTLALEVTAAISTVKSINVIQLFEAMMQSLPTHISSITKAIVAARPELAYDVMISLGKHHSDSVVTVAEEIGQAFPELRVITTKAAMEVVPESALEMAEYYAQLLADEHEAVRPAERDEDTSEEFALNISAELWNGSAEQALGVAVAMADAIPESAVSLAQEYIATNAGYIVGETNDTNATKPDINHECVDDIEQYYSDNEYESTIELVTRFAEVAPQQSLDIAVAVVSALPGSAAEVAAVMANNISEREPNDNQELNLDDQEQIEHQDMVELVCRLTEVSPDNAMDLAVAVVEQVPESAAKVAAEYAANISDDQSGVSMLHHEAVELVNRLTTVSPDNAMDVAVAIVEVIPGSASKLVDAMSEGDESVDEEWMTSMKDKPKG